jgi:outer membrane protein TolC
MKQTLLLWFVGFQVAFGQTAVDLTIDDVVRIGMEQSKMLRASMMEQQSARARAEEIDATQLPSVKLYGNYQRLSEVDPFRVSVPFSPEPITISPIVLDNYALRLSIQQPLFTGFRLHNTTRAAELSAEAAEFDYAASRADLVYQSKHAYWLLYQSIELKRVIDENVVRLEAFERDATLLLKAGLATRNDLLNIKVQLSNARLSQIDAAHNVRVAMMNLNNVIGQPLDTEVRLVSTPAADEAGFIEGFGVALELHGLLGLAMAGRPDLRALELRLHAGEASVTAAQGGWWPQVHLSGNYYESKPNARYLPTRNEFKDSWDIGVTVSVDIWNWGSTASQVEQAELQRKRLEFLHAQMKDNIVVEITAAHQRVAKAREKIEVAKVAVEQAGENAHSMEQKHRNGLATSSELLDADVALLRAETSLTSAQVEYEIERAALVKAVGVEPLVTRP